jgi:dihydroorotate dehydrogenase
MFGGVQSDVDEWIRSAEALRLPDAPPTEDLISNFVRICLKGRMPVLLAAHRIPHPSYNYFKNFEENSHGPWDSDEEDPTAKTPPLWNVLGFDLAFPLGVPASVLTSTPDWVRYYARRGFNVITFKTVRSVKHDAHAEPNWVFLRDLSAPIEGGQIPPVVYGNLDTWPTNPQAFSTANSFGVPSFEPTVWMRHVQDSLQVLGPEQLLIVSVMGSSEYFEGEEELIQDFVKVALMAQDAGARAIELNLSCPNTLDPVTQEVRGPICANRDTASRVVQQVREALRPETKLVAKLSYMPHEQLEGLVRPLVEAGFLDGVAGINTMQTVVESDGGQLTFPDRVKAGVSGIAIRDFAMDFVRSMKDIKNSCNRRVDILGMGGVMTARDVLTFQACGADAVQTASAAFFNPRLPSEVQSLRGNRAFDDVELEAKARVLQELEEGPKSFADLRRTLEDIFPPEAIISNQVRMILRALQGDDLVKMERSGSQIEYAKH